MRPIDPADRLSWAPGDAAQCDLWFPPYKIGLDDSTTALLPLLVMTMTHFRFTLGRMNLPAKLKISYWELGRC